MVSLSATASSQWLRRAVRPVAFITAAVSAAMTYALLVRPAWIVDAFPWPESPMSFIFLASIAASIGVVWLTVGLEDEPAALAGVGVNVIVASAGACVLFSQQAWTTSRVDMRVGAVGGAVLAAFGIWLWGAARRIDVRDPRRMPPVVRWAFIVFAVVLVVAGSSLCLRFRVFPWPLWGGTATLFGFIFLGAAAYFAHAVISGRWSFAAPALWGFLAYDIVLFVPYVKLLFAGAGAPVALYGGAPVNRTSLIIYLAVLTVSALLALYSALLHPTTRLWSARPAQPV